MENNIVEMNERFVKDAELGFGIVPYLTAEEVDAIAQYVCEQENYANAFYAKCFMVLQIATDMTQEQIEKVAEDVDLFNDVFIYRVFSMIENYDRIEEAIGYYNNAGVILRGAIGGVQKLIDNPEIQGLLNGEKTVDIKKKKKKD